MKTFRQELSKWIDNELSHPKIEKQSVVLLNEIKSKLIESENKERDMVNFAYYKGYTDCENDRGRVSNYYNSTYKISDILSDLIKRSEEEIN